MMPREMTPRCPVCTSRVEVRPLLAKNGCQLHRCGRCDHIFVAPAPTDDELSRLYSFEAGYQKQPMMRFSDAGAIPRKFHRSLELIARHAPGGSLLDVGCSSGRLLFLARERGYRVQGIERNRDTAEIARANDLPVVVGEFETAELPQASFDAIHLGDIIEHVRDPAALLERVRTLLSPDGVVLVVTPNHDALFPRATYQLYRVAGVPWSHPTPPFHLHQFSVTSLRTLLRRCGLRVVEESFAPCSLRYELRSTGVFRPLKQAIAERRPLRSLLRAAACAGVTLAYGAVWVVDRAAVLKRRDFVMSFVASPALDG